MDLYPKPIPPDLALYFLEDQNTGLLTESARSCAHAFGTQMIGAHLVKGSHFLYLTYTHTSLSLRETLATNVPATVDICWGLSF